MWSPHDHFSWNDVIDVLFENTQEVLALVAIGGKPTEIRDGCARLNHTTEFYLKSRSFADDYEEGRLIIALTVCFLLSRFMEEFPPTLAGLNGERVSVETELFQHKDELSWCVYGWPLKDDMQFYKIFEFAKSGVLKPSTIFERFLFINGDSGEIGVQNGAANHLIGRDGAENLRAKKVLEIAKKLTGYVVCWPDMPDQQEMRRFFRNIEVDDTFSVALDYHFDNMKRNEDAGDKRPAGRPSRRAEAARIYRSAFPEGHDKAGKSWKEALSIVNSALRGPISEDTLKRAVASTKPQ